MASKSALSYALKLLGVRDYFKNELFSKTAAKFGEIEASMAIEAIESYGWLNDEKTADNYIRIKLLSGYGPYYISGKLYEKGFSLSADEIIKKAEGAEIDLEAQIEKLAARYKGKSTGDLYKDRAKCMRFLMNRGYPLQLCDKILTKGDFFK